MDTSQVEEKDNSGEWEGLFLESLAHAQLGEMGKAKDTAETLRRKTESLPTDKEKRRYYHLLGNLALAGGDLSEAFENLHKAESMLPTRGTYNSYPPTHVPIWFSLGAAHLAKGEEDQAVQWLQRIAESTTEHILWPIHYVRSFYYLGKIHENRGEMRKAREYYRRFYEYWKDGDMDRERVEEVKSKLGVT